MVVLVNCKNEEDSINMKALECLHFPRELPVAMETSSNLIGLKP